MYADMEFWTEVRRRVLTDELSKWAVCREYELSWHTLKKIFAQQEPPGYRRKQPRRKPKLEPFLPIIHEILRQDGQAPKKQRHTAWRIFERLRDEHRFTGGYTIVKDTVRAWKQSHQEVFLPLSHPPGEAQVDFGEATITLQGVQTKGADFSQAGFGQRGSRGVVRTQEPLTFHLHGIDYPRYPSALKTTRYSRNIRGLFATTCKRSRYAVRWQRV